MPFEKVFKRDRNNDGTIRKIRTDAHIGNVAPDIQEKYGFRSDKSVGSVLDKLRVTSISKARKK